MAIVVHSNLITAAVVLVFLGACSDSEERADVGYSDGYAAGYNTTCKIRATLVEGDWDNRAYAEAYQRGYADGSSACIAQKQN